MYSQHRKLDIQRRIEHHVGSLLERRYPLVFSRQNILPLSYRFLGRIGSLVVVTDNSSQQSIVSRRYPVVVVERYTRQRRDINLVFNGVWYIPGQQRIKRVNSLDDEHCVVG